VGENADAGALGELTSFRQGFYECATARADALFELSEAVLCTDGPIATPVDLSLAPEHRRGHGMLYAALNRGRLDVARFRNVLAGRPLLLRDARGGDEGVVRGEHGKSGKPDGLVCTVARCSTWCRAAAHGVGGCVAAHEHEGECAHTGARQGALCSASSGWREVSGEAELAQQRPDQLDPGMEAPPGGLGGGGQRVEGLGQRRTGPIRRGREGIDRGQTVQRVAAEILSSAGEPPQPAAHRVGWDVQLSGDAPVGAAA
jgi:hypothetical protein